MPYSVDLTVKVHLHHVELDGMDRCCHGRQLAYRPPQYLFGRSYPHALPHMRIKLRWDGLHIPVKGLDTGVIVLACLWDLQAVETPLPKKQGAQSKLPPFGRVLQQWRPVILCRDAQIRLSHQGVC